MTDDGGPAFPRAGFHRYNRHSYTFESVAPTPGMSLRDWFAGQALAGIAKSEYGDLCLVSWCYEMADAMLKERSKR